MYDVAYFINSVVIIIIYIIIIAFNYSGTSCIMYNADTWGLARSVLIIVVRLQLLNTIIKNISIFL